MHVIAYLCFLYVCFVSFMEGLCSLLIFLVKHMPDAHTCTTRIQDAYKTWHTNFAKYPNSLVRRTKKCWDSLRSWASTNYPQLARSLTPGVSESFLDHIEATLGWELPLSVRLLYRFCGGQDYEAIADDEDMHEDDKRTYAGLLGGYKFYDHNVDVKLLSLEMVVYLTKNTIPHFNVENVIFFLNMALLFMVQVFTYYDSLSNK